MIVLFLVLGALEIGGADMVSDGLSEGLVAHWALGEDCRDGSVNALHASQGEVTFTADRAALFEGRPGGVSVADAPALDLGDGDFSIALWINADPARSDAPGDIISKYDADRRTGFHLSLQSFQGVSSGRPNWRNLFFGVDAGADGGWIDRGRPGNAVMVWALCVYEGALYAGTFEMDADEAGHVYRYDGAGRWIDCGAPYSSNAVTSLAVYQGKLYAAASHYRSKGSSLAESENTLPGGRVFRYEGGTQWTDCGRLGESEAIGGMAEFEGRLYASSMYAPAGLYRYENGQTWSYCGHPEGRVEALTVYAGKLYGSGWDEGRSGVYRYDGESKWTDCGTPAETTQTYSFATYRGRLYAGTWPSGKVFRYGGGQTWEDCGRLGEEKEVMGMAVYNGKLYAGTLPLAEVYRYDGDGQWICTDQLDTTPDVTYRRAWSMAVFQGKLFCGTLPSGHVHAFEAGQAVSHDYELGSGWQHVAAIRADGQLRLYVAGKQVAESTKSEAPALDVTNDVPLHIGFGPHDYFQGSMRDVRIYNRALDEVEVVALHTRLKQ